jgi:hypothetical protein
MTKRTLGKVSDFIPQDAFKDSPTLPGTEVKLQAQTYFSFGHSNNYSFASLANMSALATKAQSHKIFEKLKTKPANKVCPLTHLKGLADLSF